MTQTLTFEAQYPHPPEQVWQALTQPQALSIWLMDNNFEPRVGHCFQFRETALPGLESVVNCQVLAVEPPRRLVYTWQTTGILVPSMVTWTLTPIDGGTQLRLHHTGLTKAASPLHPASFLQQQWSESNSYSSRPTSALYSMTDHSIRQDSGVSVARYPVLNDRFESGWHYRLAENLPKTLAQLATA